MRRTVGYYVLGSDFLAAFEYYSAYSVFVGENLLSLRIEPYVTAQFSYSLNHSE